VRLAPLLTVTAAVLALILAAVAPAAAAPPPARTVTQLQGDLDVHDPALVTGAPGRKWYVFASGKPDKGGGTIDVRSSADNGRTWAYDGTIWDAMPAWLHQTVPGANNMWAPAVHQHAGTYYLYYAVSTTGHNDSVIGLATNTTLDRADPAYKWVDQGKVVRSLPASDFNAIDPEVVEDGGGTPWLVFGSYWSGIQMVQLEWPSGKRSADRTRHHVADRKIALNAIEAPSILHRGDWYYLFTSWDRCCRGVDSTYRIVVGRSASVTGPYVDRDGKALTDGGGTTVLASKGDRVGPGGESLSAQGSTAVIAYHYYDGAADGVPTLGLRQFTWSADGWPQLRPGDQIKAARGEAATVTTS
jgi:arabinan endo-1,5-alpha-L-arabinosidase